MAVVVRAAASIVNDTGMRWSILAVVVVVVGVAFWQTPRVARMLRKDVELTRRELPGAALLMPAGKALEEKIAYQDGGLEIQFGGAGRAKISWSTSEPLTDSEFETMLVRPMQQALSLSIAERAPVTVVGKPGSRWLLRGEQIDLIVTEWACGKRSFNLIVGARKGASVLEQRIRDSFECTPDPALDGKARVIGVELDVGPDFGLDGENPLTIVSLDADGLVVSVFTGRESPADAKFDEIMPKLMDGIATGSGVTGTSFKTKMVERGQGGPRKVWSGQGTMDGEPRRMLSTAVVCGADKYIALYMGDAAKPESRGLDYLLGARCAKNPKRPPPFDVVARNACAHGDKRGCVSQN
jgi:hypothetical protein